MSVKMEWVRVPNRDVHILHVNFTLLRVFEYGTMPQRDIDHSLAIVTQLYDPLSQLPGVVNISCLAKYAIHIHKGRVFDWADLKPRIEAIVCNYYEMAFPDNDRKPRGINIRDAKHSSTT